MALSSIGCDGGGSEAETETGTETGGGETGDSMALEIIGSYTDEFGDAHEITAETWTNGAGSFAIGEFKNQADWLVAQNDDSNMFNPGKWSRFDWSWQGEVLYYCQSVFDADTVDDAVLGSADATDLMMGCGGFPWTNLTP